MNNLISRNPNLIILSEYAPKWIHDSGVTSEQFFNLIASYGFKLKYINEESGKIEDATAEELIALNKGTKYCTLYLGR